MADSSGPLSHPSAGMSSGDDSTNGNGTSTSMASRIGRLLSRTSVEQTALDRSKSRAVLQKARSYSIAYFLAWSFPIIRASLRLAGYEWPIAIWYLASIFNPLSGLYNLCIYVQPKVGHAMRGDSSLTWRQAVGRVLLPSSVGTRSRDEPNNNGNNHAPQQNIVRLDSSDDKIGLEDEEEKEENYQEQNKGGKVELRRLSSNIV